MVKQTYVTYYQAEHIIAIRCLPWICNQIAKENTQSAAITAHVNCVSNKHFDLRNMQTLRKQGESYACTMHDTRSVLKLRAHNKHDYGVEQSYSITSCVVRMTQYAGSYPARGNIGEWS